MYLRSGRKMQSQSPVDPKVVDEVAEDDFQDARAIFSTSYSRMPAPKMPPFKKANTEDWFRRLEMQLALFGAKTEWDRFRGLLTYVDDSLFMEINDYVQEDVERGGRPYTVAKEKLIKRFQRSRAEIIKGLMSSKPKDGLPSVILNTLQRQGGSVDSELVREIWEDSLPDHMIPTLQRMKDLPIEIVAEAADAIHQATKRKTVHTPALTVPVQVAAVDDIGTRLDRLEVFLLKKEFAPKNEQRPGPRPHQPPRPNRQPRTAAPQQIPPPTGNLSVSNEQDEKPPNGKCWYHWKFGEAARKCYCSKN